MEFFRSLFSDAAQAGERLSGFSSVSTLQLGSR
jgi:hypothetical protein